MNYPKSFIVLILSAVWVFYNSVFSGTILYFDSLGYDYLGKILIGPHPEQYLIQGPSREPLYPMFVSLNMVLANNLHIPYTHLILLTQGLLLLWGQSILFGIFQRIKVQDGISAVILAYFVFSPTILRSSLIVYSEIFTYVPMLLVCLKAIETWDKFKKPDMFQKGYHKCAIGLGAIFLPIMFAKAIFELIAPVFLFLFAFGLYMRNRKHKYSLKKCLIFFILAYGAFELPVIGYKALNKVYNGNFAFTDRGSRALYGTTARRALPTSPQEDLAQMLYVFPDKSICDQIAGKEPCSHWFYVLSDTLGSQKYLELKSKGYSIEKINSVLSAMALKLMLSHPFRTIKGMFWEGAKICFWEYPSWGMVILPRDVRSVYDLPGINYFFLFGVNLVSVLFFLIGLWFCIFKLFQFNQIGVNGSDVREYLLIAFSLIINYIIAHSFFFLNERNALPIIPIFLVMIGTASKTMLEGKRT